MKRYTCVDSSTDNKKRFTCVEADVKQCNDEEPKKDIPSNIPIGDDKKNDIDTNTSENNE